MNKIKIIVPVLALLFLSTLGTAAAQDNNIKTEIMPVRNLETIDPLPDPMYPGTDYTAHYRFNSIADENVKARLEFVVKGENVGKGEWSVDIEMNENELIVTENSENAGNFRTEKFSIKPNSNYLQIQVSSLINLVPGPYDFSITLYSETTEVELNSKTEKWDNVFFDDLEAGVPTTKRVENTDITGITLVSKENLMDVEALIQQLSDQPGNVSIGAPNQIYSYFHITKVNVSNENIENVQVTFRVEKSWISANSIDKSTMSFNRWNDNDNTWTSYSATKIRENENYSHFSVTIPGFSTFSITAKKLSPSLPTPVGPSPNFTLTNLTVSPSEVSIGEEVTISAVVSNPNGPSGTYTATLKVDGNEVDSREVEIIADGESTITFTWSPESAGTHTIDVGGVTRTVTANIPFTINNLTIDPDSITAGGTATVSVDVTNDSGETGTYTAVLEMDGSPITSQDEEIDGGDTETITFTIEEDEEGTHTISIGDLTGTLTVTSPSPGSPFPTVPLALTGATIISLAVISVWVWKRRK